MWTTWKDSLLCWFRSNTEATPESSTNVPDPLVRLQPICRSYFMCFFFLLLNQASVSFLSNMRSLPCRYTGLKTYRAESVSHETPKLMHQLHHVFQAFGWEIKRHDQPEYGPLSIFTIDPVILLNPRNCPPPNRPCLTPRTQSSLSLRSCRVQLFFTLCLMQIVLGLGISDEIFIFLSRNHYILSQISPTRLKLESTTPRRDAFSLQIAIFSHKFPQFVCN
jgi:hypothetical protein